MLSISVFLTHYHHVLRVSSYVDVERKLIVLYNTTPDMSVHHRPAAASETDALYQPLSQDDTTLTQAASVLQVEDDEEAQLRQLQAELAM